VTGSAKLPAGTENGDAGDNISVEVEAMRAIAMEESCASPSAKAGPSPSVAGVVARLYQ